MAYIGKITDTDGTTGLIGSTLYGTCATEAATVAKVGTLADFDTLITGVTIHIKFTYTNTATDPTLNVNGTGAKRIYKAGTTSVGKTVSTSWDAGAVVSFTYDGSAWIMNDHVDNTWRGIQNNLTSDSTSDSLSAAQGKALATGSARDSTKLPLAGGTMTGDITFTGLGTPSSYPAKSKGIYWSGGTDAIDMYYNVRSSDAGELIINMKDDTNVRTSFAYNGTVKSYIDTSGTYNGNATSASKWNTARTITIGSTGKTVDGSGDQSWSLAEIGAAPAVTGGYLPLSGGTMTGIIKGTTGGNWIQARDKTLIYANGNASTDNLFFPMATVKSNTGAWSIGNVATTNRLYFVYTTDADYNASPKNNAAVTTYIDENGIYNGTVTNISTTEGLSDGARPVFYGYLNDNTKLVYHSSFTYNPTGGVLSAKTISRTALKGMITGTGTTAQDKGSSANPRYFPAKWTFNTGLTAANGDVFIIKIPCAGHSYGVFMSVDNGANYYPISVNGTSRLTTHYGNGYFVAVMFKSDGSTADVYPVAGGNSKGTVSGGCWQVLNYYDSGNSNTYDRNRYNANIKAGSSALVAGNIIVGKDGVFNHLKSGGAFDISYPILYLNAAVAASATTTDTYDILHITITTTQSITLTAYKPVFIKGTLSGTIFTPVSTTPLTQTVPSTDDGYSYIYLGNATSTTTFYMQERHPIYTYKNGAFSEISHTHPYLPLAGGTMTGQIKTSFNSSIATGSMVASSTTIPNLCEELRYSSGVMGSANITTSYTKDGITVAAAWYNFIWIPHRSGGVNGAASGDNCNYGSLILSGMTGSGAYIVRYASSAISELRNLYKDTTYSANNGVGLSGTTFYNTGVRSTTINGDSLRVNTNGTNADLTIPFATKTGIRWTAVTHGQTWSRIYWATGTYGSPDHYCGTSGLLSISCTRGNVVVHATFLVTSSHAGSNYANCIQLSSGNYINVKVRLVAKNDSSYYFEIYDDAASIASGTEQSWYCCFIMLGQTDITTYDYFYDGTTVPSGAGYAAMNEFTTTAGSEAAAIKNITRSGTTFTATRQDGSTFTFTQQDNNSDVKVRQTLNTNNKNYPLILSYAEISSTTTDVDNYTYRNNSIYANPSEPKIYAASGTANTSPGFSARRTDTDVKVSLMVGSAGANHGVYSHKQSKWLVHADASYTYVNSISVGYTLTSSNTDAWSSIGVGLYSSETTQLKVFRSDTDGTWPTWVGSSYAAGIAFGGVDTKGGIAIKYNSPKVNFFGGQNTSSVTKPSWYFSIAGTTATNYNLDNFLTSHQTITTGSANGTISVAGTDVAVKGLGDAAYKGYVTSIDTSASLPTSNAVKTFVEGKGYVTTDTKNTAGSTDTSSKIFLIGATSQAANPQTYSDNEVYATSGVLTTKSVQVGGGSCTMQYNSTTQSLDFVFA